MRIESASNMNSLYQRWLLVPLAGLILASGVAGCSRPGAGGRTTPATAIIKGQHLDAAQLVDAGNTTPEAALETSFWASANGNFDADAAAYAPQMQAQVKRWDGSKAKFASHMKRKFARFQGLQIIARKAVAADRVELRYQFEFSDALPGRRPSPAEKIVSLVNVGGAWKFTQTSAYTPAWDTGSEPEPR